MILRVASVFARPAKRSHSAASFRHSSRDSIHSPLLSSALERTRGGTIRADSYAATAQCYPCRITTPDARLHLTLDEHQLDQSLPSSLPRAIRSEVSSVSM